MAGTELAEAPWSHEGPGQAPAKLPGWMLRPHSRLPDKLHLSVLGRFLKFPQVTETAQPQPCQDSFSDSVRTLDLVGMKINGRDVLTRQTLLLCFLLSMLFVITHLVRPGNDPLGAE